MANDWRVALTLAAALASLFGANAASSFAASWLCLALVGAVGVVIFAAIKRRAAVAPLTARGITANPTTLATLGAAVMALSAYNIAALVNLGVGVQSLEPATVTGTAHGFYCSGLVTAELSSGKLVVYCAGYDIPRGVSVQVKVVSSLLGTHVARS